MKKKIRPLFIGLYDAKLLGIRYLSTTLKKHGYETTLIFLKDFNSYNVDEPTAAEYALLYEKIRALNPDYIGISIMCSFYLGVAEKIAKDLKEAIPGALIITGGAYPTLFPERCLNFCDAVFRGESEAAIVEFTNALERGLPYDAIANVATKTQDGACKINPPGPLAARLDELPHPDFGGDNKYYINNSKIERADPEAKSISYETTTSRGCPNRCSYCSAGSIREIYSGHGKYIRQRGVGDVIAEIKSVREKNPGVQLLRFWDEIFPWDKNWVRDFAEAYKKEIGLPFEAWGHPKLSAGPQMKMLKEAGLSKIVVGVQSGCPKIRKEIYLRNETQEEILECAKSLSEAKIPIVVYDFILGHPFETEEDLRATLELCRKLAKPYRLQLHGLSFLPGTPIEEIAVSRGVKTWDEIREEQSKPLREQYRAMHWWRSGRGGEQNAEKVYWYTLIYLCQFKTGELIIKKALKKEKWKSDSRALLRIHRIYNNALMLKVGTRKLAFIAKRKLATVLRKVTSKGD